MLLRTVRWKPWAVAGAIGLAWWSYQAPIMLTKRLHAAAEESANGGVPALVTSRVDFSTVNARLSGDLLKATNGRLDGAGFSHLFLYGWLPQQRPHVDPQRVRKASASDPSPNAIPVRAQHSRLHQVRYRGLNRFLAIYWDPNQYHQVALTLERKSLFHRWYVTRITQHNMCAYDFDCSSVVVADIQSSTRAEAEKSAIKSYSHGN